MDYSDFSQDITDDFLENVTCDSEKLANIYDITKLLTNSVHMNSNNNSSNHEDIFAQSLRSAFIMTEEDAEHHINNSALLSELASPNLSWVSQLASNDCKNSQISLSNSIGNSPSTTSSSPWQPAENFPAINPDDLFLNESADSLPPISSAFGNGLDNEDLQNLLDKTSVDNSYFNQTVPEKQFEISINPQTAQISPQFNTQFQWDNSFTHQTIQNCLNLESIENIDNSLVFSAVPMQSHTRGKKTKRKRAASDREKTRTQSVNSAFQVN